MSSDKRSVSTDALETLGTIIGESAGRDAIHLAVEPVIAAHSLRPGDDVGFVEGGVGECDNPVGIVDPFLKAKVKKGERFWLVVYPRQITSLRHVWTHPAFGEPGIPMPDNRKAASEAWLRNFCETEDCPGYETVMEAVTNDKEEGGDGNFGWWKEDDYIGFRGIDAHASIPPEFWEHVENVIGRKLSKHQSSFTCSC